MKKLLLAVLIVALACTSLMLLASCGDDEGTTTITTAPITQPTTTPTTAKPSASTNQGTTDTSAPGTTDTSAPGTTDTSAPGTTDTSAPGTTDTSAPGTTDTSAPGTTDTSSNQPEDKPCTEHKGGTATCTAKAVCEACGEEYGELAAHTEETVAGKAATCKEAGLTEGKKCSVCGETIVAQTEIPVADHTEETVAGKAATCKEAGLTEGKKCSVCGETIVAQTEIPVADHTEETLAAKESTCSETGLTEGKQCSVCGEITVEQKETKKKAHDYSVKGDVVEADCTNGGYTWYSCSGCDDKVKKDTTSAKGHDYSIEDEVVEATCSKEGYTMFACSGCGELVRRNVVPALNHAETKEEKVEATCMADGITSVVCIACGTVVETKDPVAKLQHKYDKVIEAVEGDCLTDGYTLYGCSVGECGTTEVRDVVKATGHSYVGTSCEKCGASADVATLVVGNNTAVVSSDSTVFVKFVSDGQKKYSFVFAGLDSAKVKAYRLVGNELTELASSSLSDIDIASGAEIVFCLKSVNGASSNVTVTVTEQAKGELPEDEF